MKADNTNTPPADVSPEDLQRLVFGWGFPYEFRQYLKGKTLREAWKFDDPSVVDSACLRQMAFEMGHSATAEFRRACHRIDDEFRVGAYEWEGHTIRIRGAMHAYTAALASPEGTDEIVNLALGYLSAITAKEATK